MKALQVIVLFSLYYSVQSFIPIGLIAKQLISIAELIEKHHKQEILFQKIDATNRKIDALATQLDSYGLDNVVKMIKDIPERVRLELQASELENYVGDIHSAYDRMASYMKNQSSIERLTLEDFARSVVSQNANSVQNLLDRIYAFMVPSESILGWPGLFNLVNDEIMKGTCNAGSQQQMIVNLYETIAIAELKGYATVQFSYMILKSFGKGNFVQEIELMENQYKKRTETTLSVMSKALEKTSTKFWQCDPYEYVKEKNYIEVSEFLQGYVQNEVDLNQAGTCSETCNEYSYTRSYGCYENLYCRQQRSCKGRILNCKYVESDFSVCPSKDLSKRYDYIEYESGVIYGQKSNTCDIIKVESWWRWLFWRCSYCMCICDEQGVNSHRFFNLRQTVSDVANNRVITGMKFVKRNRIIHIQIQQGKLLENGTVDVDSVEWVPVENYKTTDRDVYSGQDFYTLTWEKRALDLDDIQGRSDEILTGIRLKELGGHLNLEVKLTPVDIKSGKLYTTRSYWKDNLVSHREKLSLENRDKPTRAKVPSLPDSRSGQYTEFIHTGFVQDAAQTTVPFIDAQAVVPLFPIPLSGMGIYHKGQSNYGGFIGLNVFTYNISSLIKTVYPSIH